MQLQANTKRAPAEFFKGDWVLVSSANWPLPKPLSHKFNDRFYGPFQVIKSVNGVSYQLALPAELKVHNMFHISLLRRYNRDENWGRDDPTQLKPERILKHRIRQGQAQYLIHWKDRPNSDRSWVDEKELSQTFNTLVQDYYNKLH